MATLDNIQNLPYEPGDIVRDKRDRKDYVVQSVALAAGGIGAVVVATNLLDGKLREFHSETVEGFDLMSVRKNVDQLTPDDVARNVSATRARHLRNNEDILRRLGTKEGEVFRDLLMVGDDVPDHLFRQNLVEIADALVSTTKTSVTKEQVKQAFRNALGGGSPYSEEFLDYFAGELSNLTQGMVRTKDSLGVSNVSKLRAMPNSMVAGLSQIMFGDGSSLQETALQYVRQAQQKRPGRGFVMGDAPKAYVARELLGRGAPLRTGLGPTGEDQVWRELMAIQKPEERAAKLFKLFIERNTGREMEPGLEKIAKRIGREISRAGARGETHFMLDAIMASDPDGMFSALEKRYNRTFGAYEGFGHLFRSRSRRSAAHTLRRGRVRAPVAVSRLAELPDVVNTDLGPRRRLISLDKTSVFDDLLRQRTPVAGKLSEARSVLAEIVDTSGVLLTDPQTLRAAVTEDTIDVGLLKARHTQLAESIDPDSLQQMARTHSPLLPELRTLSGQGAVEATVPMEATVRMEADLAPPKEGLVRLFQARRGAELSVSTNLDALLATTQGKAAIQYVDVPEAALARFSSIETPTTVKPADLADLGRFEKLPLRASAEKKMAVEAVRPVQAVDWNQYWTGRKMSKMGLSIIEDATGKKAVRLLGTTMEGDVHEQLARGMAASKAVGSRSVVLDIETGIVDAATKERGIRQIAAGFRKEGGGVEFSVDTLGRRKAAGGIGKIIETEAEEVGAILKTAEVLKNVDFVGTQSGFDLRTIEERALSLAARSGNEETAQQLVEAAAGIRTAIETKGYDVQVLYHALGVTSGVDGEPVTMRPGQTSQPRLTRLILGREERHVARYDVADVFELFDKAGVANLKTSEAVLADNVAAMNMVFYDAGTRSSQYGSFRRLVDISDTGEGGVRALFQDVGINEQGEVISVGGLRSEVAENASALGGRFHRMVAVETGNTAQVAELMASSREAALDLGGRDARSINVFARTFYDELGTYDPKTLGPFGLFEGRAVALARNALSTADLSFLEQPALGVEQAAARQTQIESTAAQLAAGVEDPVLRERTQLRIMRALESSTQREALFSGPLDALHESELGKALLGDSSHRGIARSSFLYASVMGEAAEDASLAKDFVSLPRIRLSFGQASVAANVDVAAGPAGDAVKELASRMLVSLSMEPNEGGAVTDFLRGMDGGDIFSPRDIGTLKEAVADYSQIRGIKDHTTDLYEALSDMHFLSAPKHRYITEALGEILKSSDYKKMVADQLSSRIEPFVAASAVRGTAATREDAESLVARLAGEIQAEGRADTNLEGALERALRADRESVQNLFRDVYEGATDWEALAGTFRGERLASAMARADESMLAIEQAFGTPGLGELFGETMDVRSAAFEAGLRGRQVDAAAADFIKEAAAGSKSGDVKSLHQHGLDFRRRMAEAAAPSEAKAMHAAVNRAAGASQGAADSVVRSTHEAALGVGPFKAAAELGGWKAPLLAAGGLLALMAMRSPQREGEGGRATDRHGGHRIAQFAEIPGPADPPVAFVGQTAPFQINLTFSGFIKDKAAADRLSTQVYDTVSGSMRVVRREDRMEDRRNKDHRLAATELLRESSR